VCVCVLLLFQKKKNSEQTYATGNENRHEKENVVNSLVRKERKKERKKEWMDERKRKNKGRN